MVGLTLCPFFIHKGVNGISRRTLDKPVNDLEEGLAQIGRTFLRRGYAFLDVFTGIVFPGSTPAKAVSAPRCVKRFTSPISAMSWGHRVGRTPFISITTGYSGSVEAVSSIFCRRVSTVSEAVLSIATACAG